MIPFLRHTLAAAYLYSQEQQPLRTWSAAETRGAILLALGALLAWRWAVALRARGLSPGFVSRCYSWTVAMSLGQSVWIPGGLRSAQ